MTSQGLTLKTNSILTEKETHLFSEIRETQTLLLYCIKDNTHSSYSAGRNEKLTEICHRMNYVNRLWTEYAVPGTSKTPLSDLVERKSALQLLFSSIFPSKKSQSKD